jgi:beta-N-acetylhexosaminidase
MQFPRVVFCCVLVGLAAFVPVVAPGNAGAHTTTTPAPIAKPDIKWKPIRFNAKRKKEMVKYSVRHYRMHTWRLTDPKVIVEHYTGSSTFASAWGTFNANKPDLGELPGVCAQFVVDKNGTIYQLVDLGTMCRHTVGLNWTAIGIEHVGTSDKQILHNNRQMNSSLELTVWLMQEYGINLDNVIGHSESLTSPYHHERVKSWRCQTHSDWSHKHMKIYRRRAGRLATRHGIPLGPPTKRVKPNC